ncbi:mRNA-binding ribosome biosynthesis protein NOP4 [Sporobolomyces salmoneus]|uniref:mRNA-binding ribosome biosynthesis protein NOP4 n=1 Tax=Sporobolomyces salmoneus TaxID=183962 RepID=UPI00316E23AE
MPGAKRYFDADSSAGGDSPAKHFKSDRGGGRGRGRGGGSNDRGRGSRGRGGRGGGGGRGGRSNDREDRPKKEPFKPKSGFIAEGLKAYADAAEQAKVDPTGTDATSPQTTLYLTNLPPTLTSPQLTLIFSSYAPIRAAFVVSTGGGGSAPAPDFGGANAISVKAGRDRTGKSTSRGFGYVRFVLRTDAEGCLKEWGNDGIPRSAMRDVEGQTEMQNVDWNAICGKGTIKLSWAKKKLREGEAPEGAEKDWKKKKEQKVEVPPTPPQAQVETPAAAEDAVEEEQPQKKWRPGLWDYNAPRTVIVQGLPLPGEEGSMEETAEEEEEESKPEAEEQDKMEVEGGEATGSNAVVAPKKSKPVDWSKALKQRAKKIGDVEEVKFPVELASGEQVALVTMYTPRHAHDLMTKLNNHVFRGVLVSAAVKSTWDLCQRLGRAKGGGRLLVRNLGFDVKIPDLRAAFARFGSLHSITLPVDSNTNKPRGFAFIYFITKSCAEAALKAVNGTRIFSGMAAERIASEGGKEGKKKEVREKKKAEKEAAKGGGGDKGRLVAVDWALGKEDWKKAQEGDAEDAEKAEGASGSEAESSEGDDSEEESDEESDEEDEDSDMSPVPEGTEDSDMSPEPETHPDDDDDELEEEPKPPQEGTTLFVRNISFETTEAELYDLFKQFGKVRYARIVYDPTTKRSRGTAFVCMWNDDEAEEVLRESETLNAGLGGETSNKKTTTSLLMADPSTSGASRLTLHGRVLAAVAAVSKGDADKLREDRDKKGNTKTDRRNLYLMREGVIFPSWAIAKTLSAADMDARQSSFDARKGLLRSNPSLYISRTRLSVRQIPLYVTDGMMKRLANHALKQFQIDMKAGLQKPFTPEELAWVEDASGAKEPEKTERKKGVPLSRVRQAKILRQSDRVDPLTGLGRSKGYGFLELGTHADALRVLRWANANKDVNRLFRVWWREALEKMIDQVEKGEGKVGKEVKVKEKEERLKRLQEKMTELEEEERIAEEKASKREAAGKAATGEGGRSSKCLIIEFSIENAVTTKRRAEKADRSREKARRAKERGGEESSDSEADDDDDDDKSGDKTKEDKSTEEEKKTKKSKIGSKKRKAERDARPPSEKKPKKEPGVDAEGKPKEGARIGSLIGRKRRAKGKR